MELHALRLLALPGVHDIGMRDIWLEPLYTSFKPSCERIIQNYSLLLGIGA